jgi:hypothetical protein
MKASTPEAAATGSTSHPSNRCVLAAGVITCLMGCSQKVTTSAVTISATADQSGQHPATAVVKGVATVSCSDGAGSQGTPVDCLILGPGYLGEVALHQSVSITGPGTVRLTCSGQGRCSAVVTQ